MKVEEIVKPSGRRGYSKEVYDEIQNLRNNGVSGKEISAMYGISLSAIYTHTFHPHKTLGITPKKRLEMIRDMRKAKMPWHEIGKELKLSKNWCRKLYRDAQKKGKI